MPAGARHVLPADLGRSRGGLGTKIHLAADRRFRKAANTGVWWS
jgi:hypothetical protein